MKETLQRSLGFSWPALQRSRYLRGKRGRSLAAEMRNKQVACYYQYWSNHTLKVITENGTSQDTVVVPMGMDQQGWASTAWEQPWEVLPETFFFLCKEKTYLKEIDIFRRENVPGWFSSLSSHRWHHIKFQQTDNFKHFVNWRCKNQTILGKVIVFSSGIINLAPMPVTWQKRQPKSTKIVLQYPILKFS